MSLHIGDNLEGTRDPESSEAALYEKAAHGQLRRRFSRRGALACALGFACFLAWLGCDLLQV